MKKTAQKFIFAVLFLSLGAIPAQALPEKRYTAEFLLQLAPADANGKGETSASLAGVSALNNNPAGLAFAKQNELLIGFASLPYINAIIMKEVEDGKWSDYGKYEIKPTETEFISYALHLGRLGNLGLNFTFNHSGRFIRVDKNGRAVNAFPEDGMAFTIGYGFRLPKGASAGVDVKSVRSKVTVDDEIYIGKTYALNFGIMHQMGKRVRTGAVLQNIGKALTFKEKNIPNNLRRKLLIGAVYITSVNKDTTLSLNAGANPPFEEGPRLYLGAELLTKQLLALRIGYIKSVESYYDPFFNIDDGSSVQEERSWTREGLTMGLGLRFKGGELNLARTPYRKPVLTDGEKLRLEGQKSITSFSYVIRF